MFDFPNAPVLNQQVLEPNGAVLRWDGVKWVNAAGQVSSVTPTYNNVGRNLLHNSMFNIQQRGIGQFTASGFYTADRWVPFMGGAGDSISIQFVAIPDAERSQIGDEAANFELYNAFVGGAGATNSVILVQWIENVRRLSGKTVTVSFWAVTPSGTLKLGVSLDQVFGTGGSPSARVNGNGQAVTLTNQWARYSVTLAVPSAIGQTFGTNADSKTELNFWYSAASGSASRSGNVGVQSGTIILWGVQLEIGSVATPLEKPDPQQDLAKCQRFYQTGAVYVRGYNIGGGAIITMYSFPVQMRAVPTTAVALLIQSNTNGPIVAGGVAANGFAPGAVVTAAGDAYINMTFTASADL